MTYHFFAYLARMKYINRWGLMRNTRTENIAEHSLEVSILAHALAPIGTVIFSRGLDAERAAVLAMYHDSNEIITGDLPTPVKYNNPRIKEAYHDLEAVSREKLVSLLPGELRDEYRGIFFPGDSDRELMPIIKAADKLSAYIKCVEEERAGNSEFNRAAASTLEALKKMDLREVDYFLENFMESYSLTLDEQG
jgi:5'-deoxynucleotidase